MGASSTWKDRLPKMAIILAILGFVLFLLLNVKVLPGAWHVRVLHGIRTQTNAPTTRNASPGGQEGNPLFKYLVTETRAAPLECDYNGHKSNSTYFSDLDVNRTQLLARLFKAVLSASHYDRSKRARHLNIALGSTCCVFRREIRPLQKCQIWSRVLTWDEKWVYIVSYFVSSNYAKEPNARIPAEENILASGIARYVFKDGRKTVRPVEALTDCGVLSLQTDESWNECEAERAKGMLIGQGLAGLEALPGVFCLDSGQYGRFEAGFGKSRYSAD